MEQRCRSDTAARIALASAPGAVVPYGSRHFLPAAIQEQQTTVRQLKEAFFASPPSLGGGSSTAGVAAQPPWGGGSSATCAAAQPSWGGGSSAIGAAAQPPWSGGSSATGAAAQPPSVGGGGAKRAFSQLDQHAPHKQQSTTEKGNKCGPCSYVQEKVVLVKNHKCQ